MVKTVKVRFLEYFIFRSEEAKYLDMNDIKKEVLKIVLASAFVVLFSYLMVETSLKGLWIIPFLFTLAIIYDRFVLLFSWIKREKCKGKDDED